MDSDYSGRPLPDVTDDDVRNAAKGWGDPVGEIITLADGRWATFSRGAWYEVSDSGIDFDKPVDAAAVPESTRRPLETHATRHAQAS